MEDLSRFIAGLPKAELHIHIEGSLEPELMLALAARNGVALRYADVEAVRAAYRFANLQDFLDLYYQGMQRAAAGAGLLRPRDGLSAPRRRRERAPCRDLLRSAGPYRARRRLQDGDRRPVARARRTPSASSASPPSLILCFLRHLDEASAERTLDEALPWRDRIIGVGLDSSEKGHPPSKFERVFARARGLGLHAVAHAGEEGPRRVCPRRRSTS